MKKILLSLAALATISLSSFGQAPEGFKYQAVVRDASSNPMTDQAVGIQITIQQGSIAGTAVYQETFAPTTNGYGLVNLEIGTGITTDDFTIIDWANGPYFIETAVDATGGTSYAVMGTSQLMSVPYALYAKTSGNGEGPQGDQGIQGETGLQGVTGNQGETGPAGPQGEQGIQGETGPQGIQGETGAQGIQGEAGQAGANGVDGIDAVMDYDSLTNVISADSTFITNIGREMVTHIHNKNLTGDPAWGGITGFSSTPIQLGGWDYLKYTAPISAAYTVTYFGFGTSNGGSNRPITSKSHFLRDTWITALYMNTPWCNVNNGTGTLFQYGVNSYVDIEIGSPNDGYTKVYRLGNPSDDSADEYHFPSSTSFNDLNGGIRIDLLPQDWIYIPAGTNQATVVRFKYVLMDSSSTIFILNEVDGTSRHLSEIDGYVTFVQY